MQCAHPTIGSLHSRFAFPTVEAYHRWFYTDDARALLNKLGYSLVAYTVPSSHVVASSRQAIYSYPHASFIGRFRCNAPLEKLKNETRQYISMIEAANSVIQRTAFQIESIAA